MDTPTFSARLKAYRRKCSLTQSELASLLGVSSNYVQMLEGGREVDENSSLAKLFNLLEGREGSGGPRGNLKEARIRAGLTQAQLAKKIGYQIGVLQAVEDGTARASEKMIEKIVEVLPELSKDSLMGGSDSPVVLSTEVSTFGKKPDIILPPGMTARYVPLISWAQAGTMTSYDDEVYEHEGQLAFDVTDPKAFAVKLRGDSMSPQYAEGDTVILYPSVLPQNGDLVIARLKDDLGGDVMFKLFHSQKGGEKITLTSYNPLYPPLEYQRPDFAWIYPAASVVKRLK